ncbi:hypothetical protein [Methylobacterium sp. J-068]|uniref:hypothetical protein n=1 Tax=Methylobacterium sp. J-068 TaxID=2836649 RepID=UPI001FBC00C2|nr:hypothetical protein [Methylobacterium sp. J-068]MCJ2035699.1 hypothetical protein [Methylobacterium sp. J-068]
MRILRNIVVGSVFGGSALTIAFACIDRIDHPAPVRRAGPVTTLTRVRPPEPTVTGSLPVETGPSIRDILGRDGLGRDSATRESAPKSTTSKTATAREAAARVAVKPAAKAPVKRTAEGFDTERLNALMRGDPAVTLARSR